MTVRKGTSYVAACREFRIEQTQAARLFRVKLEFFAEPLYFFVLEQPLSDYVVERRVVTRYKQNLPWQQFLRHSPETLAKATNFFVRASR
jgi:hypothetical protein